MIVIVASTSQWVQSISTAESINQVDPQMHCLVTEISSRVFKTVGRVQGARVGTFSHASSIAFSRFKQPADPPSCAKLLLRQLLPRVCCRTSVGRRAAAAAAAALPSHGWWWIVCSGVLSSQSSSRSSTRHLQTSPSSAAFHRPAPRTQETGHISSHTLEFLTNYCPPLVRLSPSLSPSLCAPVPSPLHSRQTTLVTPASLSTDRRTPDSLGPEFVPARLGPRIRVVYRIGMKTVVAPS